eukprot:2582956-Amphidinium_carterae.1
MDMHGGKWMVYTCFGFMASVKKFVSWMGVLLGQHRRNRTTHGRRYSMKQLRSFYETTSDADKQGQKNKGYAKIPTKFVQEMTWQIIYGELASIRDFSNT